MKARRDQAGVAQLPPCQCHAVACLCTCCTPVCVRAAPGLAAFAACWPCCAALSSCGSDGMHAQLNGPLCSCKLDCALSLHCSQATENTTAPWPSLMLGLQLQCACQCSWFQYWDKCVHHCLVICTFPGCTVMGGSAASHTAAAMLVPISRSCFTCPTYICIKLYPYLVLKK